jgi:hypothetical protein
VSLKAEGFRLNVGADKRIELQLYEETGTKPVVVVVLLIYWAKT